jgi:signal transduction histidine kinase
VAALAEEFPELAGAGSAGAADRPGPLDGASLDLITLMRAAETISGEVLLDRLLGKLMEVCLAAAGAQRGAFILEEEQGPHVRAMGTVAEPAVLLRSPLASSPHVPRTLIEQVRRSGQVLVLADATQQGGPAEDPYLSAQRIRSVLALPISRQGKLVGVLYVENNLATRVFTPDRVQLLQLLSSLIAISLENSLLFEALTGQVEERKEAVRLRDEFLSIASHELNTPMTSLALTLGALASAPEDRPLEPATAAKLTSIAQAQTRRMISLIQELLDATRIDRGSFAINTEPVELTALVQEAVTRFQPELERARCQVILDLDGPIWGRWDPLRIDQVVLNLLSNATKFGAGRPIEIRVGQTVQGAWLSVGDQGIGVDPAAQERIFERFGRAVSAQHYGGLGLGLYICRRIVESHGGSIVVSSEPGQGATFRVTLPLAGPAGA